MMDFSKTITTPVLFLVFNRPEKTRRVFDIIQKAKPQKLYVAADAPRSHVPADRDKCDQVRKIVTEIDWGCDVKYLFHKKNLGCSHAGKAAWDWLFSHEQEMIFIEDDGLVALSFFWYCQELLERYRENHKIAYIYGTNYGITYGENSYFYTRYGSGTYAMATWKRVYDLYEYKLDSYQKTKNMSLFKNSFLYNFEYVNACRRFAHFIKHGGNTYDLQITYLCYKYNMFNIVPNVNMVTNIGFDSEASNTKVEQESKIALKYGNKPRFELDNLIHPDRVAVSKQFEEQYLLYRAFNNKSIFQIRFETYFNLFYIFKRKLLKMYNMFIKRI